MIEYAIVVLSVVVFCGINSNGIQMENIVERPLGWRTKSHGGRQLDIGIWQCKEQAFVDNKGAAFSLPRAEKSLNDQNPKRCDANSSNNISTLARALPASSLRCPYEATRRIDRNHLQWSKWYMVSTHTHAHMVLLHALSQNNPSRVAYHKMHDRCDPTIFWPHPLPNHCSVGGFLFFFCCFLRVLPHFSSWGCPVVTAIPGHE